MQLKWYVYLTTTGYESYFEEFDSKEKMNQYLSDIDDLGDITEVLIISGYTIEHRKKT